MLCTYTVTAIHYVSVNAPTKESAFDMALDEALKLNVNGPTSIVCTGAWQRKEERKVAQKKEEKNSLCT